MFKKAERKKAKLKLALMGPAGAGKSFSALLLAKGIGGRVAVIDTENGSACLYADNKVIDLEFDVTDLGPPYSVDKYIKAIKEAKDYDVLIIDSISHQWAAEGGILDRKNIIDSVGGNSFTNWGKITPDQERFRSAILSAPNHVICTMRSKMEYVLETNEKGKQIPKKVGLKPIQRDDFEYEFTSVLDVSMSNIAVPQKDRTGIFPKEGHKITEETGEKLKVWLDTGAVVIPVIPSPFTPPTNRPNFEAPLMHSEKQRLSTARTKAGWIAEDVKEVLAAYGAGDPAKMKPGDYRELCSRIEAGMTPGDIIRERQKEMGIESAPPELDEKEEL